MKETLSQKIISWFLINLVLAPILGTLYLFLRLIKNIEVIGAENLSKRDGDAVILASNHPSMLETILIPTLVYFHFFPASFFRPLKYLPWNLPDVLWLKRCFVLQFLHPIPVRYQRRDFGALNRAAGVLRSGGWLTITPEGGRTAKGTDFLTTPRGARIRRPRSGIGRLIRTCNPKIVPIWVEGADKVLPIGSKLPLFWQSRTTVVIGPVLDLSHFQELPDNPETWEEIALLVAENILVLSEKVPN